VERGWGVNSSEDAIHYSVLYICKYFVGYAYCILNYFVAALVDIACLPNLAGKGNARHRNDIFFQIRVLYADRVL
jgi:hypothetical protein